jgi:hypothetical protein
LIGLSTKGNLVFKEGLTETKITKSGRILWIDWFMSMV